MDTGFGSPTGEFTVTNKDDLKHIPLYILYLLFPLICIAGFFILETVLVLHVLRETRPMILLSISAILFAIGQIFQFIASVHICTGTNGRIDGALFQTLFTLLAVIVLWFFWSSITEDEWPDESGYTLNSGVMDDPYPHAPSSRGVDERHA